MIKYIEEYNNNTAKSLGDYNIHTHTHKMKKKRFTYSITSHIFYVYSDVISEENVLIWYIIF